MNNNSAGQASRLSEAEHQSIVNLILTLESSHNQPLQYAQILRNAVIHIEPEGKVIEEIKNIEEFRKQQLNTKTYTDFTILKETHLSNEILLVTCSETIYRANFRGMHPSSTKLYNIILKNSDAGWQIILMQIVKNIT